MQFKGLGLFTAALAACSVASAQLTASQIASNIYLVSNIIQGTGYRIQLLSPAVIASDSPLILEGLRETVKILDGDITQLKDGGVKTQYSDADKEKICKAWKYFLNAERVVLYQVTHQHYLLETPLAGPLIALWDVVNDRYKGLAEGIANVSPACAAQTKGDQEQVDELFEEVSKLQ